MARHDNTSSSRRVHGPVVTSTPIREIRNHSSSVDQNLLLNLSQVPTESVMSESEISIILPTKGNGAKRSRESRSRNRQGLNQKSSPSEISPALSVISISPSAKPRRSTRLAEKSFINSISFKNDVTTQKELLGDVSLPNLVASQNTSMFTRDFLSERPILSSCVRIVMCCFYAFVLYKLFMYCELDKWIWKGR